MGMHSAPRLRKVRFLLLLSIFMLVGVVYPFKPVSAQTSTGRITVRGITSDSFPEIGVEFEVFDGSGGFVTGLKPQDVQISEGSVTYPANKLELLEPGVQFTIAINLTPEMGNRFAGATRLENIMMRLSVWSQMQNPGHPDLVSLATNTGLQLIRSSNSQEWKTAFDGLATVDVNREQSNLNALTRAVDLATDPSSARTMKRAILYVTPLPGPAVLAALPNLAERAASQGTSIFVWLVGSTSAASSTPEAFAAIEDLALQTGGSLFLYSGQEALPDPNGYLNPLRYYYRATYQSGINASGSYDIGIIVANEDMPLVSDPRPLYLNVLPPNPIFLSPPSVIERLWIEPSDGGEPGLEPNSTTIQIVVEFPDGHPRALKTTRLFVNDQLAAENNETPFDVFEWNISSLEADGRHNLVVEVEDMLGLTHRSIETPVDVKVEPAKTNILKSILTGKHVIIFGGILAAGAVLILALGMLGKRAQSQGTSRRRVSEDPLTQPVFRKSSPAEESSRLPDVDRPTWPRYAVTSLSAAPAWLLRVQDTGSLSAAAVTSKISPPSNPASAIPLSRRETSLGSDEKAVNYKLNSPTVSPVHARITQTTEGGFLIQDANSVAGTWVNYSPVPSKGILLRHGDLVQIGKVAFKFELANPPEERQPKINGHEGNL